MPLQSLTHLYANLYFKTEVILFTLMDVRNPSLNFENTSFEFYAVKDINPGDEIFVWYGDENYWSDGRQTTVVI